MVSNIISTSKKSNSMKKPNIYIYMCGGGGVACVYSLRTRLSSHQTLMMKSGTVSEISDNFLLPRFIAHCPYESVKSYIYRLMFYQNGRYFEGMIWR
jgi:hypothetical protein